MKKTTAPDILRMKAEGKKIPVLTAYGFQIASLLDNAGIPLIIVGDSLGMVEAGYDTTLPVTMDEMIYHTRSVVRGAGTALVVADMPFGSYQASLDEARTNAVRLIKETGAGAVKLEGGIRSAETVKAIVNMDIPVMGHIGLTPQSVHAMGGYKVQGKEAWSRAALAQDALAIEKAGAFAMVLEGIPASLAKEITASVKIPTIGIGAGVHCDGQVLVVNDMLGIAMSGRAPKFVKRYADLNKVISSAVKEYIKEVEAGAFPSDDESY
ncbi:MAG: 3-methyl-2-oxobutanoate hydroxymethyltransferase [Deltaproteobacteria bacterium]|nr:3-methyl-2-oxobutanoate hydroxymethyltransferase [Deltaproteobacteria bacterium]